MADPITHFAVADGIGDHGNHLIVGYTGGQEPGTVEAFAKVVLVVGVQFARPLQANFVHVAWQMRPAVHRLAGTAGINDSAHAEDDGQAGGAVSIVGQTLGNR